MKSNHRRRFAPLCRLGGLATLLLAATGASAQTIDYDANDNGLIDVDSLVQLNAIRWDLNGNGAADNAGDATNYGNAFPTPATGMGCPGTGCIGYELRRNLDFDTDGDGDVDSSDPGSYTNFGPIGGTFTATFRGNGHTISNLRMSNSTNRVGLFGVLSSSATVRGVGLIAPTVSRPGAAGVTDVDALVGRNDGTILGCYVLGGTVSSAAANAVVGGLVGRNQSLLRTSYATASVSASTASAGGLAGVSNADRASPPFTNVNGRIRTSYAAASVSGTNRGGLTSNAWPSGRNAITNSYWDNTITSAVGSQVSGNLGKTTSQLQEPTAYTGIYSTWDDTDGDAWDFGAGTEYPVLKFDGHDPAVQRPGLHVYPTALSVPEGGSATYAIRLHKVPSATVTVMVEGATAEVTVEPATLQPLRHRQAVSRSGSAGVSPALSFTGVDLVRARRPRSQACRPQPLAHTRARFRFRPMPICAIINRTDGCHAKKTQGAKPMKFTPPPRCT